MADGVLDEVVDEHPQSGLPAADRHGRLREVRARSRRPDGARAARETTASTISARSTSACSNGCASPRASACRPSSSATSRRCSVSASSIISARRSAGRSGWRRASTASPGRSSAACAARGRRRPRSGAWRPARARGRRAERPSRAEHRVEARAPASAARPGRVVGHAALEVLVGGDARRRRAAAASAAAAAARPPARPRSAATRERDQPERGEAAVRAATGALSSEARLETTSSRARPSEVAVAQRRDVGAVVDAAGRERVQAASAAACASAAGRRCRAAPSCRRPDAASWPSPRARRRGARRPRDLLLHRGAAPSPATARRCARGGRRTRRARERRDVVRGDRARRRPARPRGRATIPSVRRPRRLRTASGSQDEADAANRVQHARLAAGLELAPQVADEDVGDVGARGRTCSPRPPRAAARGRAPRPGGA